MFHSGIEDKNMLIFYIRKVELSTKRKPKDRRMLD